MSKLVVRTIIALDGCVEGSNKNLPAGRRWEGSGNMLVRTAARRDAT